MVSCLLFCTAGLGVGGARASSLTVTGQWTLQAAPNVNSNDRLDGVAAVSASDAWTVGYASNGSTQFQTLIEHWNGSSWSVVPSPDQPASSNVLNAVSAVSSSDVWAAGYYQYQSSTGTVYETLIEHWNGSGWSIIPSPNQPVVYNALYGVAAVSSSNVWAVGGSGTFGGLPSDTLIEHWNGTAWSIVSSPGQHSPQTLLTGISAVDSSDIWAVGYYTDSSSAFQTLTEHWNGSAWSLVSSPNQGATAYDALDGVSALSSSDVWAVGWGPSGGTMIQHWNGSAWSIIASPSQGVADVLEAVVGLASNDIWAVGDYHNGKTYQTLTEHWNGTTWAVVPSPNASSTAANFLLGVANSGGKVFAVGQAPAAPLAMLWSPGASGPSVSIASTGTCSGNPCVVFNLRDANGVTEVAGTEAINCSLAVTQANGAAFGPENITPNGTVAGSFTFSAPNPTSAQVTATKMNAAQSCRGKFNVSDPTFATTYFDPVMTAASVGSGMPMMQTQQVDGAEHWVTIRNLTPGLSQVTIVVNGRVFLVQGLGDGEERVVDVGSGLHAGANTVRLVTLGRLGASAVILFSS